MSDTTQGTWKASAPFGGGWNAGVVEDVGSDLSINNGTIDIAAIAADSLFGNPGTVAAKPSAVAVGPGLTLPATGTLAAQWQTGTVVSVVGGDLNVNSGTIDIAPITAGSLFGNPGTAAAKPSAIAVGTGLTLSAAGTLSATGGGGSGITSLVIGSGLSPAGTISSGGTTVAADWRGGTVVAVGSEFVEPSGTLHYDQMATYISASATIDTTYFGKNLVDNSAGASDIVLTLTTLAANTHLTFNLQNNSAHHYVRLRPGTGVTINGVPTSDYLLPNFTGGAVSIDSTGTAYTTGAALSFWNPSAGYVTSLNGLTITNDGTFSTNGTLTPVVDGTSVILSSGTLKAVAANSFQTIMLSGTFTTATGADATQGNVMAFEQTSTIAAVYVPLASMVNGGSYIAQIAALNGSNVVQSPISTSATIIASDTTPQTPKFAFASNVVVSPGTNYAVTCSRTDGLGSFVLPTIGFNGGGTVFAPKCKACATQAFAATTGLSVGQTLSTAAGPRNLGFDIL